MNLMNSKILLRWQIKWNQISIWKIFPLIRNLQIEILIEIRILSRIHWNSPSSTRWKRSKGNDSSIHDPRGSSEWSAREEERKGKRKQTGVERESRYLSGHFGDTEQVVCMQVGSNWVIRGVISIFRRVDENPAGEGRRSSTVSRNFIFSEPR